MYIVSDVRKIEIHTAEPILNTRTFEVQTAIPKLKSYNSPGSIQILAELLQAGDETLLSEIHKLINSI
jgi:hypothetical protein